MSSCSDSQWFGGQKLLRVSLDFNIFTRLVMTCRERRSRHTNEPGTATSHGRGGPNESACALAFMPWPRSPTPQSGGLQGGVSFCDHRSGFLVQSRQPSANRDSKVNADAHVPTLISKHLQGRQSGSVEVGLEM